MKKALTVLAVLFIGMGLLAAPAQKRPKSFVFKEIEIKGKIQKPEAMYFLSRARFSYRTLDLQISFVPKVQEAVFSEDAF
jgi:hypothetical protein